MNDSWQDRLREIFWGDGGVMDWVRGLQDLQQTPRLAFLKACRRTRERFGRQGRITGRDIKRLHRLFDFLVWAGPDLGPETILRGMLTLPEGYLQLHSHRLFWWALEEAEFYEEQLITLYQHLDDRVFDTVSCISTLDQMEEWLDRLEQDAGLVEIIAYQMSRRSSWRRGLNMDEVVWWLQNFWSRLEPSHQHIVQQVWRTETNPWLCELLLQKAPSRQVREEKLRESLRRRPEHTLELLEQPENADLCQLLWQQNGRPTALVEEMLNHPNPALRQTVLRLLGRAETQNPALRNTASAV